MQTLRSISTTEIPIVRALVEKDLTRKYEEGVPPNVHPKYWDRRYRLLDRYDRGVWLDEESWYSITPQAIVIAEFIAQHCIAAFAAKFEPLKTVVDLFCGCGGNTIAFANACEKLTVIGVDFDPQKLEYLRHNAANLRGCIQYNL
eukprot:gene28318-37372_t